jgi:flagellin
MGIVVNTNIQSVNAQRLLGSNTRFLGKTLERLSSGYRINRSSDDAAGLQISETLRSQVRGNYQALSNVQDGINVLNIADGSLDTITQDLQRIRELAVQGANDTLAAGQRSAITQEIRQLATNVSRVASSTEFNGKKLLDGSINTSNGFKLQTGANATSATNVIDATNVGGVNVFGNVSANAAGITLGNNGSALGVFSSGSALRAISRIDAALSTVNTRRAALGALGNRLESTANNLSTAIENLLASESRIRNVDVARESANLTKYKILQQASSNLLSQANQSPSIALSLLQ